MDVVRYPVRAESRVPNSWLSHSSGRYLPVWKKVTAIAHRASDKSFRWEVVQAPLPPVTGPRCWSLMMMKGRS